MRITTYPFHFSRYYIVHTYWLQKVTVWSVQCAVEHIHVSHLWWSISGIQIQIVWYKAGPVNPRSRGLEIAFFVVHTVLAHLLRSLMIMAMQFAATIGKVDLCTITSLVGSCLLRLVFLHRSNSMSTIMAVILWCNSSKNKSERQNWLLFENPFNFWCKLSVALAVNDKTDKKLQLWWRTHSRGTNW